MRPLPRGRYPSAGLGAVPAWSIYSTAGVTLSSGDVVDEVANLSPLGADRTCTHMNAVWDSGSGKRTRLVPDATLGISVLQFTSGNDGDLSRLETVNQNVAYSGDKVYSIFAMMRRRVTGSTYFRYFFGSEDYLSRPFITIGPGEVRISPGDYQGFSLTSGQWQTLCVVWDIGNGSIGSATSYLDGVLEQTVAVQVSDIWTWGSSAFHHLGAITGSTNPSNRSDADFDLLEFHQWFAQLQPPDVTAMHARMRERYPGAGLS